MIEAPDTGASRIFTHFLDRDALQLYYGDNPAPWKLASIRRTFRLGLLMARDYVAVPASSYFEAPLARALVDEHAALRETGRIRIVGSGRDLQHFLDGKRLEYESDCDRYPLYFNARGELAAQRLREAWVPRRRSTTSDITTSWLSLELTEPGTWRQLAAALPSRSSPDALLQRLPVELGSRAFIGDYAVGQLEALLGRQIANPGYGALVTGVITRAYVQSYADELEAALLSDTGFMSPDPTRPRHLPAPSVRQFSSVLLGAGLLDALTSCTAETLALAWERSMLPLVLDEMRARSESVRPYTSVELRRLSRRQNSPSSAENSSDSLDERLYAYIDRMSQAERDLLPDQINNYGPSVQGTNYGDLVGGNKLVVGAEAAAPLAAAIRAAAGGHDPEAYDRLIGLLQARDVGTASPEQVVDLLPSLLGTEEPGLIARLRTRLNGDLATGTLSGVLAEGVIAALGLVLGG